MGRSYWFECARCGYRAKVAGRADRGLNFFVQTIVCRECREVYDAVVRVRLPDDSPPPAGRDESACPSHVATAELPPSGQTSRLLDPDLNSKASEARLLRSLKAERAPSFQAVANRLLYLGVKRFKWRSFELQCPVSAFHRIEIWNEPYACPRCGQHLDKNVLPYRIWD